MARATAGLRSGAIAEAVGFWRLAAPIRRYDQVMLR